MANRRSASTPTDFGRWLLAELQRREMGRSDLARSAGVFPSTVSKWLYSDRPTPASCDVIADALRIPLDRVLEAAGHRPSSISQEGEVRKEIASILHMIPEPLLIPFIPALRGLAARSEQQIALNRLKEAFVPEDGDDDPDA